MAKTVEEWVAEGNVIKRWGEGEVVVKQNGFTWVRQPTWPEWRCSASAVYGRPQLGTSRIRVLPFVCGMKGCDDYGTESRGGRCWCATHAEEYSNGSK